MHIDCGGHTTTVGRLRALLFLMTEVEEDITAVGLCDPERDRERQRETLTAWPWREEMTPVLCLLR